MNKKLLLSLSLLTALAVPGRAMAHSVETNYLKINEMLQFETVFSTGEPLESAKVKVYAPGNPEEPWLEGTTDENGKFAFEPDLNQKGEWEVFIGERGHADILTIPVTENGAEPDPYTAPKVSVDMHYVRSPLSLFGVVLGGGLLLWSKRRNSSNGHL